MDISCELRGFVVGCDENVDYSYSSEYDYEDDDYDDDGGFLSEIEECFLR